MRMPDEWRGALVLPERRPRAFAGIACVLIAVLAILLGVLVADSGAYPFGGQALAHIYRSEELLRQISQGNWWPQVDALQYNGAQPLRYTGPLSVYAYAAIAALAGDGVHAFVPFCVVLFATSCLVWLMVGMCLQRGWLGLAAGPLWFLMPVNLAALFADGDIPRAVCLCLLPLLLWYLYTYLRDGGRPHAVGVAVLSCLTVLTDVTFAALSGVCLVIYLLIYGIVCHRWTPGLRVLYLTAAGTLMAGIWLVPSIMGEQSAFDVPQLASSAARGLLSLFNPLARLTSDGSAAYAGLGVVALAIFGIVCARRRTIPGFWTACVVVIVASQAAAPVVDVLTGGANVGVSRVLSVAALAAFFSFILWKSLKTGIVLTVCLLLAVDAVPSLGLIYGSLTRSDPVERLESHMDRAMIRDAKAATEQRLGLVGEDLFDDETAYLMVGLDGVATSQGFLDQLAATEYNYTQVNQALKEGSFAYAFDRSLELGDDTVLLSTKSISTRVQWAEDDIDAAAEEVGYRLVDERDGYRLYHMDTPATFGVKTDYRALAIGSAAGDIARQFPMFEEAPDRALDSYTYDELKHYDIIYLDGFTYCDCTAAECLVNRLADAGVDVIVAADGVPNEERTGEKTFLGLDCESITFKGGFPTISTEDGELDTALFPSGYADWSCVYVNGLVDVLATIREGDRTLPVCGTLENSHVKVIGLNLTFYESLTGDEGVERLLERTLGVAFDELPQRQVVKLGFEATAGSVTIASPEDDVDTTLAALDNMDVRSGDARAVNNLVYVGRGKTVISVSSPWPWSGIAASATGIALLYLLVRPRKHGDGEPAAPAGDASPEGRR